MMSQFFVKIIRYWALAGGLLLIVVVLLTAINAAGFTLNFIARMWGGSAPGLPGYEDAVTLLIGVAALAMFPYCQLMGAHASVDVFVQRAPLVVKKVITIISSCLSILVALSLSYFLIDGVIESRSDQVETAVLGWPVWIFMMSAIPSCVLWAIAAFIQLTSDEEHSVGA